MSPSHVILRLLLLMTFWRVTSPSASCQDGAYEQTIKRGPCDTQHGKHWPGPPSKLEIQLIYEQDSRSNSDKLVPYADVEVQLPSDISIENVKGIQAEVMNERTGQSMCLTKNLSDCYLSMQNISQPFHFYLGPLQTDRYFFLVHHLPAPGPGHLDKNSLSDFVEPLAENTYTKEDKWRTPLSYAASNGTIDSKAVVELTFHVGKARSYKLYLIRDPSSARMLMSKREFHGLREGEVTTEAFEVTPCTGIYSIEVEPLNEKPNCVCPKEGTYECNNFCPRTSTGRFILTNHESVCRPAGPGTEQIENTGHLPTGAYTDSADEKGPHTNDVVLIVVVTSVSIMALFMIVIFIKICFISNHIAGRKQEINNNNPSHGPPEILERFVKSETDIDLIGCKIHAQQRSVSDVLLPSVFSVDDSVITKVEKFETPDEASRFLNTKQAYMPTSRNFRIYYNIPLEDDGQQTDTVSYSESDLSYVSTRYLPHVPKGKIYDKVCNRVSDIKMHQQTVWKDNMAPDNELGRSVLSKCLTEDSTLIDVHVLKYPDRSSEKKWSR